jgi:N-glycosylase/DNA lyase
MMSRLRRLILEFFGYKLCAWCDSILGNDPYTLELTCIEGTVSYKLCSECEKTLTEFQDYVKQIEDERLDDESLRRDQDIH